MHKYSKRSLIVLLAFLVFSVVADSASALRSLSVSPAGAFTATSAALTFRASFGDIICDVSLEGRLHGGIPKTAGALAGFVERGRFAPKERCTTNAAIRTIDDQPTFLFPEPWHIRFIDFEGTLPEITGIRIAVLRVRYLIGIADGFGISFRCLCTFDMRARLPLARGSGERIELIVTVAEGVALAGSASCGREEFVGAYTFERARSFRLI